MYNNAYSAIESTLAMIIKNVVAAKPSNGSAGLTAGASASTTSGNHTAIEILRPSFFKVVRDCTRTLTLWFVSTALAATNSAMWTRASWPK